MLQKLEVPVLVDFFAQWCGPCRMMQPVLEEVATRLENEAKVAKVDTDKSPRLGSRYQVEALPTLVLFFKGESRKYGYLNSLT
jgi:thioredoxin